MAYDLAMLILVAVGIIPGAIVATFVVVGVCCPTTKYGKMIRDPLSPGTKAATTLEQNNDAAQRTADAVERTLLQQTEATTALDGIVVR